MSKAKAAILGAGSFVFGPSVLKQAIIEHRLDGLELAMMDPNREAVELMAGVGQRMARELGVKATITSYTDRESALDGADFVICSAARELWRRFEMDCAIIRRHCPDHLITEFGGIAGISYSLRQIALIQEIAADMKRLCPKAWLLDVANPLPRVAQAAYEEGVPTVGFCSVALSAYAKVWNVLHGTSPKYPFEPARSKLKLITAGPNHFTWVVSIRDAATGENLYPLVREKVKADPTLLEPATARLLRETGHMPASGDNHIKDFIVPSGDIPNRPSAGHGDPQERERRMRQLRDVAEGRSSWDPLLEHESWERPIDLVAAMAFGRPAHFECLNLINAAGQIPGLPRHAFVETPADADSAGPRPQRVDLPSPILPDCQRTTQATDTIVRAARQLDLHLVREAIDLDPTILDKGAGWAAVQECLQAHADVLRSSKKRL